MPDFKQRVEELAGQLTVPPSANVRRRADRRTRVRMITAGLGCLVLAAGAVGVGRAQAHTLHGIDPTDPAAACQSVDDQSFGATGPQISPNALLTAAALGKDWYPMNMGFAKYGHSLPVTVPGSGAHALPSTRLQERARSGEVQRGGAATDWQVRETVVRYRPGGAAAAMQQLRRAPSCSNGRWRTISLSQDVQHADYESLVLRTPVSKDDPPHYALVGRVGDYQVILGVNQFGAIQNPVAIGPPSTLTWLVETALARVAAAEGLPVRIAPPAAPAPLPPGTAPRSMLQPTDLGTAWVVDPTEARSSTGAPAGTDCAIDSTRTQLQMYVRADPDQRQDIIEAVSTLPAGDAAAVLAQLAKRPCRGTRLVGVSVRAGDGALVLQNGLMPELLVRVGDRIAVVTLPPADASSTAVVATLQRLAEAAARALSN